MASNPRITTLKAWRFEYEQTQTGALGEGELDAFSLDSAVIEFRNKKPTARIQSINGIQYYDDGIRLRRWSSPAQWR